MIFRRKLKGEIMRVDKFLKNSRIIKRRTIAKDACNAGKVLINDKVAKAGSEVNPGDILTISLGSRVFRIEILDTLEHVSKDQSREIYRNID
jgi:ribosomal 50S subunit-recycling heat shock protein